jgi:hypothetical protein
MHTIYSDLSLNTMSILVILNTINLVSELETDNVSSGVSGWTLSGTIRVYSSETFLLTPIR